MKTIGIIGGMGPLATCDLYRKIIEKTNAHSDNEHIHVIIDGNTKIPDRTAAILHGGKSPLPEMKKSARRLENAGVDLLLIACNTAHYFYEDISACVDIPVINMIEETASTIKGQGISCAAILATDGTLKTGLYDKFMKQHGIEVITPGSEGQKHIMDIIYKSVKDGNFSWDINPLIGELNNLRIRGAEIFVLACTELPIAFKYYSLDYDWNQNYENPNYSSGSARFKSIDPTSVLAEKAISSAGYCVKKFM